MKYFLAIGREKVSQTGGNYFNHCKLTPACPHTYWHLKILTWRRIPMFALGVLNCILTESMRSHPKMKKNEGLFAIFSVKTILAYLLLVD